MINQGLKEYSKQITQTIGDVATGHVNINKEAANLILEVPLLNSLGPNPMGISLIYNHQKQNEMSLFGKGFKLNTYQKINKTGSEIELISCDGSKEKFNKSDDIYKSNNSNLEIKENDNGYAYSIKDPMGNKAYYRASELNYPEKIEYINEQTIEFKNMEMSNGYDSIFKFEKDNAGVCSKIEYKQGEEPL
ncbi:MAG: hypothetical protein K2I77_04710, partial [Anaeroplasmataceae bacterium]|nr:hypothetical protein [Anaeroplasmataceae bacterium]